jgi:hypothetical protein
MLETSVARIELDAARSLPILRDRFYLPFAASLNGPTWPLIHGGYYHVTDWNTERFVIRALKVVIWNHAVFMELLEKC